MSDPPWRSILPSYSGSPPSTSISFIFRVIWVIESMWVVVVPAVCALSSVVVYRHTKSPLYSIFSSVLCGVAWLASRYYILGRVPIFLSPQFKECTSVVRLLLHNINTKLIKKYGYRYPLIVNLGVLIRYYSMTKNLQSQPDSSLDRVTSTRLSRYMDFAAASYGVLFYPKHVKSSFLRFLNSNNVESYSLGCFTTSVSVNVISQMTGVPADDVIMTQLAGEKPLRPGYYICLDRANSSVVLVVRGTLTLSDALTDAACLSKKFLGGWAHHGISVSAETIFDETKVILENLLKRTGYDLVLCGHSLGAGTAVLLTLFLLEKKATLSEALSKCQITCYAYGPPPVFNDSGSRAKKWKDNITTVINGEDIIPRASLANMFNLLMQLQYIENLDLSLWERCGLIREKKSERLEFLLLGMDDFLRSETESNNEVFRPLFHTGKILWIDRHPVTVPNITPTSSSLQNTDSSIFEKTTSESLQNTSSPSLQNTDFSNLISSSFSDPEHNIPSNQMLDLFRTASYTEYSSTPTLGASLTQDSKLHSLHDNIHTNVLANCQDKDLSHSDSQEILHAVDDKINSSPALTYHTLTSNGININLHHINTPVIDSNESSNSKANCKTESIGFMSQLHRKRTSNPAKQAVLLQADHATEWQKIHVGHRFITDHWPHMYQKTLKLFLAQADHE